jgi:hypothetical protein
MKDIFEFTIMIHENLSEYVVDSFIAFIENNSVFWGGGYSENQINGGLYIDESIDININDFIKKILTFFLHQEIKIDKIEINIEDFYFHSFEYDDFMKIHSSLPIHIGYWEV